MMTDEEQKVITERLDRAKELQSQLYRIKEILQGIENNSSLWITNDSHCDRVVARLGDVVSDDGVSWLREGLCHVSDRIRQEYESL